MEQPQVRYARTTDGVNIAYVAFGTGPVLLDLPTPPFDDTEMSWQIADYRAGFEAFSKVVTLVRFDARGFGLSDRNVEDFTLEAMVRDVEAVVAAVGAHRFAIMAFCESTITALAFAAQYPDSVIGLVLREGMSRGIDGGEDGTLALARENWGAATRMMADALPNVGSVASLRQMHDLINHTTTQDGYIRYREGVAAWDATPLLSSVTVPALVTNDGWTPIPKEVSRRLASSLPDALFVTNATPRGDRSPTEDAVSDFLTRAYTGAPRVAVPVTDVGGRAGTTQRIGDVRAPQSFAAGRYVVIRPLGEGGQKSVYLVHDNALDRDCALALIRSNDLGRDDLLRFEREAQAMARLGAHSNIVSVFDIGEQDGRPFLVSEYVPGGDLRQLLLKRGRLPLDEALTIGGDIARALAVAHARGVIHRDVKPLNVWLTEDGAAKLGDFGLAFSLDRSRLTMPGTVMGTAAYLAPEQALGQPITERSDLYALGCLLYEMVCGRPPFADANVTAVIAQHINAVPTAPSSHEPEVAQPLEDLILRLLAKSPAQRPESAAAVLEELRGMG